MGTGQISLPTYESILTEAIASLAVDAGVVSVVAIAGSSSLQDDSKKWAANMHINRIVKVVSDTGKGQQAFIQGNSLNGLVIRGAWVSTIGIGSRYIILNADYAQILRDVFGGGSNINAANPLQVFDPKVWGSVSGLVLSGTVTAVPGANQFTIPALAGLGAGKFSDAQMPYYAYVLRDVGGAGAIPQGQARVITAYNTVTGNFTAAAFGAAVAVGDEVMVMHQYLWQIYDLYLTRIGYEGAASLANKLTAARALLLDQITALRMAELDPAGLPADVAAVAAQLVAVLVDTAALLVGLALVQADTTAILVDTAAIIVDTTAILVGTAAIQADTTALLVDTAAIIAAIAALNDLAQADILSDATPFAGALIDAAISSRAAPGAAMALTAAERLIVQALILSDATPFAGASIATILGLVDTAEATGPYSYTDAGGEQTVYEDAAVTRRRICMEFSNRNMTQAGTFKVHRKVDGTNYDLWTSQAVTVGAGAERAWDMEFSTNQAWKLTYTEGADEGAARNIPYNVIIQVVE